MADFSVRRLRGDEAARYNEMFALGTEAHPDTLRTIDWALAMSGVRRLDLSGNRVPDLKDWARPEYMDQIVSLTLKRLRISRGGFGQLTSARCWPNLVELDLRGDPLNRPALKAFLDSEPPAGLAALVLSGDGLRPEVRAKLQDHFRGAVVFADSL